MIINSNYTLKKIKNSKDADIIKALKVYSHNIDGFIRTDSKEILYWLDNYKKIYNDSFYIFGFYTDDILAGYAQLVFFVEEKLLFVDYLVLDELHRKNNTVFEFIEQIKEYFLQQNMDIDYVVGEIACYNESPEPPSNAKNLIRLFKFAGFGVIKAAYYSPMLGKNNFESEMNAILILNTLNNKPNRIKKETYVHIIKTIYYNHYLRWYKAFFTEQDVGEYVRRLDLLYKKIESSISKKNYIEINGYQHLFPEIKGKKKLFKYKKQLQTIIALSLFLILIFLIGFIYLFIQAKYNLDVDTQTNIIASAFILTFAFLSAFWSNKKGFLLKLIEKIIEKI